MCTWSRAPDAWQAWTTGPPGPQGAAKIDKQEETGLCPKQEHGIGVSHLFKDMSPQLTVELRVLQ